MSKQTSKSAFLFSMILPALKKNNLFIVQQSKENYDENKLYSSNQEQRLYNQTALFCIPALPHTGYVFGM